MELKLSVFKILRAGGYQLSEGMRSLSDNDHDASTARSTELVTIAPSNDLLNIVVGVLNPSEGSTGNEDDLPASLLLSNIAGFIVIVQLNVESNSITILSPCPGVLPSKYLLAGAIKWTEK